VRARRRVLVCAHVFIVWVRERTSACDCKRDYLRALRGLWGGKKGRGAFWGGGGGVEGQLGSEHPCVRAWLAPFTVKEAQADLGDERIQRHERRQHEALDHRQLTRARLHDRKLVGRCQRVVVHVAVLILDDDRLAANVVPIHRYNNALAAGPMNHLHIPVEPTR
jgi:hypothetical protein